jgi:cell division protein FtsW
MKVDYTFYRPFSIPLLIVGLALLSYIVISNDIDKIRGVSRWIKIFNLSLQPSEFMKYALIFYMADALVRKQDKLSNLIAPLSAFLVLQ